MTSILFLVAILVLAVDVFITGTVVGFLQQKINLKQLLRLQLILGGIVAVVLGFGLLLGKILAGFFSSLSVWYASTILFLLSLKLLYDGLRLHQLRKTINPIDPKGLLAITMFICLNALFVGISFGFINLGYHLLIYALILFVFALVLGYFAGLKIKKLISLRVELYAALVFFIMAIIIVLKM